MKDEYSCPGIALHAKARFSICITPRGFFKNTPQKKGMKDKKHSK